MCGIAGFVTVERDKLRHERFKFLAQATYFNTLRGDDSTGLFYVPHADKDVAVEAGYAKDILPGNEFIWTEPYLSAVAKLDNMAFMVSHNRAATHGTVTTENAHPFQEGPITLVHNGTVDYDLNLSEVNAKRDKDSQIVVDSHVICHNLATGDMEDVIGHIQGAFALVWHDSRDNTLYMIRNDRRPLHITQAKDNNTTYFMSEAEMLYAICKRNHINIGKIYEPDPGVLLKFVNGKLKPVAKRVKIGLRKPNAWSHQPGGAGSRAPFTRGTTTGTTRRKNRSASTGGVDFAETDNNIWIGGKMQAIPIPAQEQLLNHGFLIEDRFLMRPIEFKKYAGTNTKGFVVGESHCGIDLGSVTVIIHGVDQERYEMYQNSIWAIRPISIKELDNGFVLIARPVSTDSDTARRIVSNYVAERLMKQQPPKDEDAERDIPFEENTADRFIGPNEMVYTFSEMKVLLQGGCYQCGKVLTPWDSEDVIWVCDSRHPVCKTCQQDWAEIENRLHTDPAGMR